MISPDSKLSISRQCEILGISRSCHYYKPSPEAEENKEIMDKIDREHTNHPEKGVISMTDYLKGEGYSIGTRRTRKLMRRMGIHALYPSRNLSKLGVAKYVKPYLLRHLAITHPNQVWSIDISYIPMRKGFMYLIAIIDVYTRYIVGWGLYNTLDASNCIEVLRDAISKYGIPQIINSDQGCQFTCRDWESECANYSGMKVSMDGKGRCKDNIWIERFWRTIKYDYIYINPMDDGLELYAGIKQYINYYNTERHHQGIDHQIPSKLYLNRVETAA